MTKFFVFLIGTAFAVLFHTGCSSLKSNCPPDPENGNPGAILNSKANDIFPALFHNRLIFMSDRDKTGQYKYYEAEYKLMGFEESSEVKDLPFVNTESSVSPFFSVNGNFTEILFSAPVRTDKKKHNDLFISSLVSDGWTTPSQIPGKVNSTSFDGQAVLSPDSKIMIFVSDREGSIGETDLYMSTLSINDSWNEPVNLGNDINTKSQEISPFLTEEMDLLFASNIDSSSGFDIYKAEYLGDNKWGPAVKLGEPVNSISDEKSPLIMGDKIIFSSNRAGGCGNHDIYIMPWCGPVYIEGRIIPQSEKVPLNGTIRLTDNTGSDLLTRRITDVSPFRIKVMANRSYKIIYENDCFPDLNKEESFNTLCSDTSSVKYLLEIKIPEVFDEFTFEEYRVPFFVTGYYLPNTEKNLQALRMKFSYNLIGNADSTRYIENPDVRYDQYTAAVESALSDAVKFISLKLDDLDNECLMGKYGVRINVTGYADPRGLSDIARYDGTVIKDDELSFELQRGTRMTNELLSRLRAYYTAKFIQNALSDSPSYQKHYKAISWEISGSGIDSESDIKDELKRRVNINIGITPK
jgi:hypothetical protein